MEKQGRDYHGFHAMMMAAAYAEEGLADAALLKLREQTRDREQARVRPVRRERLRALGSTAEAAGR